MMRHVGRYMAFDGMTWPQANTDVGWTLRYGEPTREDLLFAASIVSAYAELVSMTATRRAKVVRTLRAAMRPERALALAVDKRAERVTSRSTTPAAARAPQRPSA